MSQTPSNVRSAGRLSDFMASFRAARRLAIDVEAGRSPRGRDLRVLGIRSDAFQGPTRS